MTTAYKAFFIKDQFSPDRFEATLMLREVRGRANLARAGLRIYIPKDLLQSSSFPFREEVSRKKPFDVLIQIDQTGKCIIIRKFSTE